MLIKNKDECDNKEMNSVVLKDDKFPIQDTTNKFNVSIITTLKKRAKLSMFKGFMTVLRIKYPFHPFINCSKTLSVMKKSNIKNRFRTP